MAKRAANVARFYVDQYDVSGFLTANTMNVEQETPVVTTFSDTGPRRLVGTYDHTHDLVGLIDTADNSYDEVSHGRLQTTSDYYLAELYEGVTAGSVAYESVIRLTSQPRQAAVGEAIVLNQSAAGSGHLARGVVLHQATVTTTGNSTGQNLGATSANVITVATFRVISGTFTSITMNVQESQNDGGGDAYATISGLTSGSMTAAGVVRVTTTAATEAWKRVNISAFSGTSVVVLVTLTIEAETG